MIRSSLIVALALLGLAGCQTSPLPSPGPVPSPATSIAYMAPARGAAPPSAWTTPPVPQAGPRLTRTPDAPRDCDVYRLGPIECEVPKSVVAQIPASSEHRVGDEVERRTRLGSAEGGPWEFVTRLQTSYQWGGDLDSGESAPDLWTGSVSVSLEKPTPLFGRFGVFVAYTRRDYDFQGTNPFIPGTDRPFDAVNTLSVGVNHFQPVHEQWAVVLAASAAASAEDGASLGDGFSWSVTAGVGYRPSDRLDLGAGIIVSQSFENDISLFGGPQFIWKPIDRWQISLEGTELELAYRPTPAWELAVAGGLAGHRFRLDDKGPGAAWIASESRLPIWLLVRYMGWRDFDVSLRVGADFSREFAIEDERGRTVGIHDADISPFVSLRAIWRP